MKTKITNKTRRQRRIRKIRAKISGTAERPRIAIFKTNKHFYAQAIDDTRGITIASANSLKMKGSNKDKVIKVAEILASKLKEMNIKTAVFDRRGFAYKAKVKLFADKLRELGLKI